MKIQCRRAKVEIETSKETMVNGRYGGLNWTVSILEILQKIERIRQDE